MSTKKENIKSALSIEILDIFGNESNNRELYKVDALKALQSAKNYKSEKDTRKHIRKMLESYVNGKTNVKTFISFYTTFYKLNDFSVVSVYSGNNTEKKNNLINFLKQFQSK